VVLHHEDLIQFVEDDIKYLVKIYETPDKLQEPVVFSAVVRTPTEFYIAPPGLHQQQQSPTPKRTSSEGEVISPLTPPQSATFSSAFSPVHPGPAKVKIQVADALQCLTKSLRNNLPKPLPAEASRAASPNVMTDHVQELTKMLAKHRKLQVLLRPIFEEANEIEDQVCTPFPPVFIMSSPFEPSCLTSR